MTDAPALWLCDVNVLVALALNTHVHHRAAHEALGSHQGRWATCPTTEAALLRLMLNPRVTGTDFRVGDVLAVVHGIHADARWRFLGDEATLVDPAIDLSVLIGHQQVTDFQLVNLAANHGAVLATFDAGIPASLAPDDRRHVHVLPQ